MPLLCLFYVSCESKTQQLASKLSNSPKTTIVGIGEITSFYADGEDLVFSTDASKRHLNYDIIRNDDSKYMIGDNGIVALSHLGILEDVIYNNISVVYRFEWDDGKKIDVRFSPSEIKARSEKIAARFQRTNL